MATVDKNFKVKHGLVVEGNTATVNGSDIITANAIAGGTQNNITVNYDANSKTLNFSVDALQIDTAGPITYNNDVLDVATTSGITVTNGALAVDYGSGLTLSSGALVVDTSVIASASDLSNLQNTVTNLTTDDIAEGQNLYFTAERAQDAIGNSVGQGLTYDDASGAIKANINGFAGAIGTNSGGWLEVKVDGTSIDTSGSGNQLRVLTGETSPVASKTYATDAAANAVTTAQSYTDSRINDGVTSNVKTWSSSKIESEIGTAVSGLVDGAPELLNTLNELAAAIADNPNYATDVANLVGTKQDSFTAGNALSFDVVANTSVLNVNVDNLGISVNQDDQIKVNAGYGITVDTQGVNVDLQSIAGFGLTVGSLGLMVDANLLTGSGLTQDVLGGFAVDTNTIASVSYVDTNFVNVADLPGQLDDYVPLTQKGANDGVATLDSTGQVPLNQLGNVPASYITALKSGESNLEVSGGDLSLKANVSHNSVTVSAKVFHNGTVLESATGSFASMSSVHQFPLNTYDAIKYVVKIKNAAGDRQISEILAAVDDSGNIAITEFGNVETNASLASLTLNRYSDGKGGYYAALEVTPASGTVDVRVYATMFTI